MTQHPTVTVHSDEKAWDVIWKWTWFTRDQWRGDFRRHKEATRRVLDPLLGKLGVKSILDCSCGLGFKTILLAEMGYEVEGSDGCALAVEHAGELATDEGLGIRFFQSRWDELPEKSARTYDCVYNDAFEWITTRRGLEEAAAGIRGALRDGGKFIFHGAHQWSKASDRAKLIEKQLQEEGRFEALATCERDGVRLVTLIAREKTSQGILGHRIHVIEEGGSVRIEIASVLDLCKWTWRDYNEVLKKAGFSRLYSVRGKGVGPDPYVLNVAVKPKKGTALPC